MTIVLGLLGYGLIGLAIAELFLSYRDDMLDFADEVDDETRKVGLYLLRPENHWLVRMMFIVLWVPAICLGIVISAWEEIND